jgi:hypothetical protein
MITAPGLEVAPVVSVSLESCGSLGCGNEDLGLLNEFLKAGGFRDKSTGRRLHGGFPFKKTQVCGVPRDRS